MLQDKKAAIAEGAGRKRALSPIRHLVAGRYGHRFRSRERHLLQAEGGEGSGVQDHQHGTGWCGVQRRARLVVRDGDSEGLPHGLVLARWDVSLVCDVQRHPGGRVPLSLVRERQHQGHLSEDQVFPISEGKQNYFLNYLFVCSKKFEKSQNMSLSSQVFKQI